MSDKTKRRLVSLAFDVVYYLCLIGFLWYMSSSHPPLRPWFWHTLMKICNRTAYYVGSIGITAEIAYGAAIEKVRQ